MIDIPTHGLHAPGSVAPTPAVELRATERGGDVYVHGRLFAWYHPVGAEWAMYVPGRGLCRVTSREEAEARLLDMARERARTEGEDS